MLAAAVFLREFRQLRSQYDPAAFSAETEQALMAAERRLVGAIRGTFRPQPSGWVRGTIDGELIAVPPDTDEYGGLYSRVVELGRVA